MTPREAELSAALAASQQQNVALNQEIEILKQKIDALVRRIFGAKSEKMNPAQLELFMAGTGPGVAPPRRSPGTSGRGSCHGRSPDGSSGRSSRHRRAEKRPPPAPAGTPAGHGGDY